MRLVEKLRALPRVIIVLPIHKNIVAKAFQGCLKIDASESPAFLRKLTDREIKIYNRLEDMKRVFEQELRIRSNLGGYPMNTLSWYILLHNIVIAEAYDQVKEDHGGGREKLEIFWSRSEYLSNLRELFLQHHADRITSPDALFLSEFTQDRMHNFVPIGKQYKYLVNMENSFYSPRQLAEMRNHDNVMKKIITDQSTVDKAWAHNSKITGYNAEVERQGKYELALTKLFIPFLEKSKNESFLTDNYKLRDMILLARGIKGNAQFVESSQDVGLLYTLVRKVYDDFR
jgi:hypothetical protein